MSKQLKSKQKYANEWISMYTRQYKQQRMSWWQEKSKIQSCSVVTCVVEYGQINMNEWELGSEWVSRCTPGGWVSKCMSTSESERMSKTPRVSPYYQEFDVFRPGNLGFFISIRVEDSCLSTTTARPLHANIVKAQPRGVK